MHREFASLCFSKMFQCWISRVSIKRRHFPQAKREREREREKKKKRRRKRLFGCVTEMS
jgi:hypothetical protein